MVSSRGRFDSADCARDGRRWASCENRRVTVFTGPELRHTAATPIVDHLWSRHLTRAHPVVMSNPTPGKEYVA